MNASEFHELVSGRRRGLSAQLLRGLLRAVEVPYTWAVRHRNRQFDTRRRESIRVAAPVVSVGNLTLGGTGKTPMVRWLARWFGRHGLRVALVSRGYRAGKDQRNDEARELEQSLPGVPHLQNPDRVAAAGVAIDQFAAQVIILDDAFQHRRIARDLDIVLIDALEPFGYGHLFPRGTLREPIEGLTRADVVVLTRADQVDEVVRARIRGIVEQHAPSIIWAECRHAPQRLLSATGVEDSLHTIAGQRVAAFAGIGNPAAFRRSLADCRANVIAFQEFPDHHRYTAADLEALDRWATPLDVTAVLCTHKDLVKLSTDTLGGKPLRALAIEMELLDGQQPLESRLELLLPTVPHKNP